MGLFDKFKKEKFEVKNIEFIDETEQLTFQRQI